MELYNNLYFQFKYERYVNVLFFLEMFYTKSFTPQYHTFFILLLHSWCHKKSQNAVLLIMFNINTPKILIRCHKTKQYVIRFSVQLKTLMQKKYVIQRIQNIKLAPSSLLVQRIRLEKEKAYYFFQLLIFQSMFDQFRDQYKNTSCLFINKSQETILITGLMREVITYTF